MFSWVQLFCDLMGYSLPGSSVHGIFKTRILEWVAIHFSRGSFWPRDPTHVSCISSWSIYHQATWEVPKSGCLSSCYWLERVLYILWEQVPVDQPFKTSTCFPPRHTSVSFLEIRTTIFILPVLFVLLYSPFPLDKEFAVIHSLPQESTTPDTTDPEQNQLSSNSDPAALTFKKTDFSSCTSHPFKIFSSPFLPAKHSETWNQNSRFSSPSRRHQGTSERDKLGVWLLWIQIPAMPPSRCVSSGKLLHLSEPSFLQPSKRK